VVEESIALMVALVFLATNPVVTVKVALVDPLGTVTLAGVAAAELLLVTLIVKPPDDAASLMVTVAVELAPPVIEVGDSDMLSSDWAFPAAHRKNVKTVTEASRRES